MRCKQSVVDYKIKQYLLIINPHKELFKLVLVPSPVSNAEKTSRTLSTQGNPMFNLLNNRTGKILFPNAIP